MVVLKRLKAILFQDFANIFQRACLVKNKNPMLCIISKDFLKLQVGMCSQGQAQSIVVGIGNRPNQSSQMTESRSCLRC